MNNKISLNILKVLKESCLKESSIKDAESFIKQFNELEDSSESPEEFLDDYDFTCALGYDWLVDLAKKYPGKNREAEKFIKEIEKAESKMDEEDEEYYADVFEYTDTDDYKVIDLLSGYFNEGSSKPKSESKKWYERSPLYVSSKSKLMKPDNVETFEFSADLSTAIIDEDEKYREIDVSIKDPDSILYDTYNYPLSEPGLYKFVCNTIEFSEDQLDAYKRAFERRGFEVLQFTNVDGSNYNFKGIAKVLKNIEMSANKEFAERKEKFKALLKKYGLEYKGVYGGRDNYFYDPAFGIEGSVATINTKVFNKYESWKKFIEPYIKNLGLKIEDVWLSWYYGTPPHGTFTFKDPGLNATNKITEVDMTRKDFERYLRGRDLINSLSKNLGFKFESFEDGRRFVFSDPEYHKETIGDRGRFEEEDLMWYLQLRKNAESYAKANGVKLLELNLRKQMCYFLSSEGKKISVSFKRVEEYLEKNTTQSD